MPLNALDENYFYDLLPAGVVSLDQRKLIQALVGGFQDRVADLRSYAGQFPELVNPAAALPQVEANVVLATYLTDVGRTITTSLDVQSDTPDGTDAAELEAWAVSQLNIEADRLTGAVRGTDLLRKIDLKTLSLLAANLGAVVYGGLAAEETALEERARAQRLVQAYFPQLKIKGTVASFSALGRLIGFDDVAATPLWTRLSPREPSDFGDSDNDTDFSAKADTPPTATLPAPNYDPLNARDGEYYTWTSGPLVTDSSSDQYYLEAVNRRNPFIKLVQSGTVFDDVPVGTYVLADGAPNRRAVAVLSAGTINSGFTAEALIEGEVYNGLELAVTDYFGTARIFSVEDQLSLLKYRASWYDVKATVATTSFGTLPVQPNSDLEDDPTLVPGLTATAPFRSWSRGSHAFTVSTWPAISVLDHGTVEVRVQAKGTDNQLDPALFTTMQTAAESLETVRPATRQIRRKSVGMFERDDSIYAAYRARTTLIELAGSGSHGAYLASDAYPAAPYEVSFAASVGSLTQTVYADSDGSLVDFAGPGFAGTYDVGSHSYAVTVESGTFASAGTLDVVFHPTSTEVIREEPDDELKATDAVDYQSRAEDAEGSNPIDLALYDEYPWRRALTWAGEDVDLDDYLPVEPDLELAAASRPARAAGENGAQYDVFVLEAPAATTPYRFTLVETTVSDPVTGLATAPDHAWPLLACDSVTTGQYHVVVLEHCLVEQNYWSAARTRDQALWVPLNDHPVSRRTPGSRGTLSTALKLSPAARLWDATRGWYLKLSTSEWVQFNRSEPLEDEFTLSFYLRPTTGATEQTLLSLSGGQVTLALDGTTLTLTHAETGTTTTELTALVTASTWNFIVVRRDGSKLELGVGDYGSTAAWSTVTETGLAGLSATDVKLSGGASALGFHDLGLWTAAKTDRELDSIRRPNLTKTVVNYPSTWVVSVNGGNLYAFELVAQGGFAYPDNRELARARWRPGYAARYDRQALYQGAALFKQVGLGDGDDRQLLYRLGLQGPEVEGGGCALITGSNPPLGWSDQFGSVTGDYLKVSPPYDDDGGTGSTVTESPTPSTWPSNQRNTNPAREFVYIEGDTGSAYQVYLEDAGTGPALAATLAARYRPDAEIALGITPPIRDEPTDTLSVLSTSGFVLSVGTGGNVYAKTDAGATRESPPLYLYRNTVVEVNVLDAYDRWADPNAAGQAIETASRETAGPLQFTNTESLASGNYLLELDVGNLGTLDDEFDGFNVGLAVITAAGAAAAETTAVLIPTATGTDARGTTTVAIELDAAVTGPFLLALDWTNDRSVPAKDQVRRLAVFGYTFKRIDPALYKASLEPALTLTAEAMTGTLPVGGVYAEINSYGTIVSTHHEALTYPTGSSWPMSNLLTGSTWRRRESVHMLNPFTLSDPAPPPVPVVDSWSAGGSAPYQFGDAVELTVDVSAGSNLRYVWEYWDGLIDVSHGSVVTKVVTAGTGPFTIEVTAVNEVGVTDNYSDDLNVNQPPEVVASATPDFEVFPYQTTLDADVTDPDGKAYTTAWYEGATLLTSGTNYVTTVTAPATVTFKAINEDNGITVKELVLSGLGNLDPVVSPISCPLTARISTVNSVQFAVVAQDPETRDLTFLWTFWDGTTASGTSTGVAHTDAVHNVATKTLSGSTPGLKTVTLKVTDANGYSTTITRRLELLENSPPEIVSVTTPANSALAGGLVPFVAVATDVDGDTLGYTWNFTAPVAAVACGGNVLYPTTVGMAGSNITATVTVDDGNGGTTIGTVPSVVLGSVQLAAPAPKFAAGFFSGGILQEFTADGAGTTLVRYSLDGSDLYDAFDGLSYTGAFTLFPASGAGVLTLKAKAFSLDAGTVASPLYEGSFTFFDPSV